MEDIAKNFEKLVKIVEKLLVCPRCFASFSPDAIDVKGFVNEKLIIEASCQNSHPLSRNIFIASLTSDGKSLQGIRAIRPISPKDVQNLRLALEYFDGDFKKVFYNEKDSKS